MWSELPSQVVYRTNADWHASSESLYQNPLVKTFNQTDKGLLTFQFMDSHTLFMLAPTGKLQVKWNNPEEKKILFKLIRYLLVAKPNEELTIKPLKQQTWIEYPVPESFKLYWCSETTEFVLKKPIVELPKSRSEIETEKRIGNLRAEFFKVRKILEELRREFRFFREPTLNEVALKSGILNSQQLNINLFLCGWKNEAEENVKRNAEQVLTLAGWLSYKEKGELNPPLIALCQKAIDSASMSSIKKAQLILKNYPDLVPKVESNQLTWSDEIKTKWIQVFGNEPPAPQTWE